jgi:AbrB family looped-hinge helix DNA binding protein
MAKVKILSKGQLVIPSELRKKYRIKPGTEMQLLEYEGIIFLIPPVDEPLAAACGSLPSKPSLAGQLLKERRKDFQ